MAVTNRVKEEQNLKVGKLGKTVKSVERHTKELYQSLQWATKGSQPFF